MSVVALFLGLTTPAAPPVHLYPRAPPPSPRYLAPAPPAAKAPWPPAWLVVDPNRKPPKEHRGHSVRLCGHHCRH